MAVRKPIRDLIGELKSWLPNYDHGPEDYPTILWRILASLPGGDEAEGMGYEPFGGIGWHEADQLGRILVAIQDKTDVEDLIAGLLAEEGEVEERRRPMRAPSHADLLAAVRRAWQKHGRHDPNDIGGTMNIANAVERARRGGVPERDLERVKREVLGFSESLRRPHGPRPRENPYPRRRPARRR